MSQVISLLHRRIAFDLPGMPYPQAVHYTFDRCSVETIEKSLERIDRSLYFLLVVFGRRNDKVKFLVLHLCIEAAATIDNVFICALIV